MKLTDELKDRVEEAETIEEKKAIIAEAGMELTEDALEQIAAGDINKFFKSVQLTDICCPRGHKVTGINVMATLYFCPICNKSYTNNL